MTLKDCYEALHGDYNDAIDRLESERLINKYVTKFVDDPSMALLRTAVAEGDKVTAFRAVHTLKGVAANVSFTTLYKSADALTEQLRDGVSLPDPALFNKVEENYSFVINVIKQYLAEKD